VLTVLLVPVICLYMLTVLHHHHPPPPPNPFLKINSGPVILFKLVVTVLKYVKFSMIGNGKLLTQMHSVNVKVVSVTVSC